VIRRLARQARRFPDLSLLGLDPGRMDQRDAAFAQAIYDAVIRRWLTLAYLLNLSLKQPLAELEPRVQALLLSGAAQLLLLDRVPVHAAINHAVEWAKQRIRPGAGSLVNAVLRKVAGLRAGADTPGAERNAYSDQADELPLGGPDGGAMALTAPVLPDDPLDRLAVATGCPRAVLEAWAEANPADEVRRLALHTLSAAPIILNTAHVSGQPPAKDLTPHELPGHHVFTGSYADLVALLAARHDLWVQDPASALPVASVADLRPGLVLDLCAGQGTKTRQLVSLFPEAHVVATDVDADRRATLAATFKDRPQVEVTTPADIRNRLIRQADLILLDVPCSNTGVLARRPEAKHRFGPASLESVCAAQRQIIADCIPLLRDQPPRGRILYSTCSLQRSENEAQGAWSSHWHRLKVSRSRLHLPRAGPGHPPTRYTDGSFSLLLD
jgi:16S rRNA (cytosine967-C5)-methyltransferase